MQLFVGAKGIVHYQGKVLLVRESSQYADGTEVGKWDVVGGRIESGEKVRDALVREVKEESGLDVVPADLVEVFDGFPAIKGEDCHVVRLYFFCEASSGEVVLSQDHDAYDWVSPDNIGDKILMGDIKEMLVEFKSRKL